MSAPSRSPLVDRPAVRATIEALTEAKGKRMLAVGHVTPAVITEQYLERLTDLLNHCHYRAVSPDYDHDAEKWIEARTKTYRRLRDAWRLWRAQGQAETVREMIGFQNDVEVAKRHFNTLLEATDV